MQNYKFKVKNIKKMDKELCKFMKVCKDCGELKLMTYFVKCQKGKDGRQNRCKKCHYSKEKNRYIHVCEYCGIKYKNSAKISRFCSNECGGKWRSKNLSGENSPKYKSIKILCDNCGKLYPVQPCGLENSKYHFCCFECRNEWIRNFRNGENSANWKGGKVQIKCDYCGEDFEERPSKIKQSEHHFCCRECGGKWMSENLCGENSPLYGIKKPNMCGENHPNWNPNLTEEERVQRRRMEGYNDFVKEVLKRDNYTCQLTGQIGKNLEVHHLNGYNWCKEGRTDINNAITLCKEIHKLFHKLYG